jgi:hypothetical protein
MEYKKYIESVNAITVPAQKKMVKTASDAMKLMETAYNAQTDRLRACYNAHFPTKPTKTLSKAEDAAYKTAITAIVNETDKAIVDFMNKAIVDIHASAEQAYHQVHSSRDTNITMSGTTSKEDLDGGILLLLRYLNDLQKNPVGKKTEEQCRTFLYDVARKNRPLFPLNRRIYDLSVERAIAQYKINKKDKRKIISLRRPTMKALGVVQSKEMVHIKF